MYRETLKLAFSMYKLVFAVVAMGLVISIIGEAEIIDSSGSFGTTILFIILAFYAHFCVLFPGRAWEAEDANNIMGFLGWSLLLVFLSFVPTMILSIPFLTNVFSGSSETDSSSVGLLILALAGIYGAVSLFTYSLFGTVLPAHIVGHEKGFGNAFRRGKKNFFYIFGRLLIGPGFLLVVSIVTYFALLGTSILPGVLFSDGWIPNISSFIAEIVLWAVNCWATIMVAWILSKAFLRTATVDVNTTEKQEMASS